MAVKEKKDFIDYGMKNYSPTRRQMLATATLKEAKEMQSSTLSKRQISLPQASGGPCMPVIMGTSDIRQTVKESQIPIPLKIFHDWQADRQGNLRFSPKN